jgi:hypothetical protein
MQSHGRADESRWKRAVYKGWMVKVVGLKLVTHQPVIEPVSAPAPGTEIFLRRDSPQNPILRLTVTDAETL